MGCNLLTHDLGHHRVICLLLPVLNYLEIKFQYKNIKKSNYPEIKYLGINYSEIYISSIY